MFISKNILHQATAVLPVTLFVFVDGLGYGWVAPVIDSLRNTNSELTLSTEECSWIASLQHLGRIVGPALTALLFSKVGCNNMLVLGSFNMFLSWLVVIFTRSAFMLYAARLIFGMATGIICVVYAVYISENTSPDMRGIFNSVSITFYLAGLLVAFVLPTYFTYTTVAYIHMVLALCALFSAFLLKEPALFLLIKGKDESAAKNFFWLRGYDSNTKEEFDEIVSHAQEEKCKFSLKSLLKNETNRKTFRIVFLMEILTSCSGISTVTSVITTILSSTGSTISKQLTILYGFFLILASFLSLFCIERFSRRTLMLTSCSTFIISHALTGILYYINKNITEIPNLAWLIFPAITSYAVIFSGITMPLTATIRGELLPSSIKTLCGSIMLIGCSITNFVTAKVFLTLAMTYGIEMNFFIYSFMSLILTVYIYFDLPETRGMSLTEIQKLVKNY